MEHLIKLVQTISATARAPPDQEPQRDEEDGEPILPIPTLEEHNNFDERHGRDSLVQGLGWDSLDLNLVKNYRKRMISVIANKCFCTKY